MNMLLLFDTNGVNGALFKKIFFLFALLLALLPVTAAVPVTVIDKSS